jgi:hypothetical protein
MELFGYWECAKYGEDPEVYRKVRKGREENTGLRQEGNYRLHSFLATREICVICAIGGYTKQRTVTATA